ncbi:hypothetical protein D7X33_19120 [Butyricicoccus sp. 1XD8-22]|nr:hypothetical protein D7X33_19120 [Butyricicoccus sp. 1XD8-22]
MKKWMVWDTASDDKIFHDTEEQARKDYNEAISMIENDDETGEFTVYLFEVKEQKDFEIPYED